MKPLESILIASALLGLLLLPTTDVFAQERIAGNLGIDPVGPRSVGEGVDILRAIVKWIYIIFFIIAVAVLLFAAFTYLFAGGDDEKINKAKSMLIYAAVAVAVALIAVSFETIVKNFIANPRP